MANKPPFLTRLCKLSSTARIHRHLKKTVFRSEIDKRCLDRHLETSRNEIIEGFEVQGEQLYLKVLYWYGIRVHKPNKAHCSLVFPKDSLVKRGRTPGLLLFRRSVKNSPSCFCENATQTKQKRREVWNLAVVHRPFHGVSHHVCHTMSRRSKLVCSSVRKIEESTFDIESVTDYALSQTGMLGVCYCLLCGKSAALRTRQSFW